MQLRRLQALPHVRHGRVQLGVRAPQLGGSSRGQCDVCAAVPRRLPPAHDSASDLQGFKCPDQRPSAVLNPERTSEGP